MKLPQLFGFFTKRSIVTKNMLLTSLFIILTGSILIASSNYIQGRVLTNQLNSDSEKIMTAWINKVTPEEAAEAKANTDRNSPIQKKLMGIFDELSIVHPNVAQGYIYGSELEDGYKTSNIAFPTAILDIFEAEGMHLGDMYDQPTLIVNALKDMMKTKQMTFTKPYNDDYGNWVTVLSPLQDSTGTVFAYMAMDIDASLIAEGKQELVKYTTLVLLATLIVIITMQYFTLKRTFAPVKDLMGALDKLSQGDFSVQLATGKDELGKVAEKFNMTVNNINSLVTTIKTVSTESAEESKMLFSTVEDSHANSMAITTNIEEISERVSQQSKSISESVTSLEEISSGVGTIAASNTMLTDTSMQMREQSQQGSDNVGRVMSQMDSIQKSVLNSVISIEQLQKRSGEIGEIVQVITEIASQTNLLSLNASIEAARAGEEGRGFAVVANEVKKLSEQSGKSAEKITELVHHIQQETLIAVSAINEGEQNVEVGIEIVKETGMLFEGILVATESVTSQIQEVSAATEEMVAETEQVTSSIKQLAVLAEKNAVVADQIMERAQEQRSSSDKLVKSAEHLNHISDELEVLVDGLKI
ncbi:methyl-accepting chemotaxis protein [Paenibacillus sp. DS2015]|uniref:methyl-accepting chemotaxis protein n=1 Tax=Paenibacillus sp. DS2015 TaxID=3373917 RepID=UPI003D20C3F3